MERTRLKRVFTQKLDSVIGYVLPIEANQGQNYFDTSWKTGPWFYREDRLYLLPGDSPMGYRLPLDSLPWTSKADYPYMIKQDPFASRPALPKNAQVIQQQPSLSKDTSNPALGVGKTIGVKPKLLATHYSKNRLLGLLELLYALRLAIRCGLTVQMLKISMAEKMVHFMFSCLRFHD